MGFEGGRRRFCLDCFFFKSDLAPADLEFMHGLLQHHSQGKIVKNWLMRGRIRCVGSGNRVDSEKARAVGIIKRRVFCREQMALVAAMDGSCYAWKPREPAGA